MGQNVAVNVILDIEGVRLNVFVWSPMVLQLPVILSPNQRETKETEATVTQQLPPQKRQHNNCGTM